MFNINAVMSISDPVFERTVREALFGLKIVSNVDWFIFVLFSINFLRKELKLSFLFSECGFIIWLNLLR